MFGKGPLFALIGIGCIVAPGGALLYEKYYTQTETSPDKMITRYAQEENCVKDSVRIAGVWVGCKASSYAKEDKSAPRKLRLDSQKNAKGALSKGQFISVN